MAPGHHEIDTLGQLDIEALQLFQAGDRRFFRTLVGSLSPRLLALASSFSTDVDDAHDLVQETWQRVFEKRRYYAGRGTLVGWVLAILRSVCLNAVRKRTSRGNRPFHGAVGDEPLSPLDLAVGSDLGAALRRALLELPNRERDVVYLRFLAQRSTRETATIMDCAEGTVKATVHHAMRKLQESMKEFST